MPNFDIDLTSRELVTAALTFKETPRIPLDAQHRLEIGAPRGDVVAPPYLYGKGAASGVPCMKGSYVDAWGCRWEAGEDGVTGEVKEGPLEGDDWDGLCSFKPPYSVLDEADLSEVNAFCRRDDRFVIPMWQASCNIFERMQYLRGPERLYMDIALEEDGFYDLRDRVHCYFMRELDLWLATDVDAVHISDDWGTQLSLLISPEQWRRIFKPCYAEYCQRAREAGKFVVVHSDGYVESIIEDWIEIGVNAVNLQLFCMDIEALAQRFHHRVAFWGEIDRQYTLPFGIPEDCRRAVRRVADAFLPFGRTGLVGQCFDGKGIPADNIRAVYDEWGRI